MARAWVVIRRQAKESKHSCRDDSEDRKDVLSQRFVVKTILKRGQSMCRQTYPNVENVQSLSVHILKVLLGMCCFHTISARDGKSIRILYTASPKTKTENCIYLFPSKARFKANGGFAWHY
jgi:hypothetical protein